MDGRIFVVNHRMRVFNIPGSSKFKPKDGFTSHIKYYRYIT